MNLVGQKLAARWEELGLRPKDLKISRNGDEITLEISDRGARELSQRKVFESLLRPGILEFRGVEKGPFDSMESALKEYGNALPDDLEILKTDAKRMERGYYVVKKTAVVTGADVRSAISDKDEYGQPLVAFSLDANGERKIRSYSASHMQKPMAVVLDDRIQSVAVIENILSADNVIKGRFSEEEVEELVVILRTGGFPAPLKLMQIRKR